MAQEVQQESMGGYPEMGASKGGGLKTIGLPVILSVLVVVGLAFMGFLPGSAPNYIANTQALNTKIDDNTSEIASMKNTVADASAKASQASADIGSIRKDITAVQGSVSGFASQSNLNALKQELDTLKSSTSSSGVTKAQYDALSAKVDSLTTQLADANAKITVLQNGTGGTGGTTTPTTGEITTTFNTSAVGLTSYSPSNATPTNVLPFTLTISNGLNKQITNLQLYVAMSTSGANLNAPKANTLSTITGSQWMLLWTTGQSTTFTNVSGMSGWGGTTLSIPANSSIKLNLLYTYTANDLDIGKNIYFTPSIQTITVTDYTVGN